MKLEQSPAFEEYQRNVAEMKPQKRTRKPKQKEDIEAVNPKKQIPKSFGRVKNRNMAIEIAKAEAGTNTHYTNYSLEIFSLPDIDTNNADEVWKRTEEYFKLCTKYDFKPNVPSYALALGVSRLTLVSWLRKDVKKPDEVYDILNRVYTVLNAELESYMQDGKVNPVTGIFIAKNNFGYVDKQDLEVNNSVALSPTAEALIADAEILEE